MFTSYRYSSGTNPKGKALDSNWMYLNRWTKQMKWPKLPTFLQVLPTMLTAKGNCALNTLPGLE